MREIDVRHLGKPLVICCFQHEDVIVDPGPEPSHRTLVGELGDDPPARILLTHIHLDHAGAVGALVRRWPTVEIWVHRRGALHLADPSKLIASATRLYGDDMQRLWGEILPVPEENLHVLNGGERIGPWRVEYTPGHASHHVSYLHEPTGTALVGDVAGVRIGDGPTLPPTPPPDIDLDAWHASLETIADWEPSMLAITHFGIFDDVSEHLERMHTSLDRWNELGRRVASEAYAAELISAMRLSRTPTAADAYIQAMQPNTMWAGLKRYWASAPQTNIRSGPRSHGDRQASR
jgi:glyoxylase-like metal-dependent hydrolase (beta-lactamase superfamily II)